MALDMKAWLIEQGVKPDAVDAILPSMTGDVVANIERSTLRQSDYSRLTNELTTKQQQLDAANERLNAEMLEFADARAAGEPITEKMRNDLAKAQGEVTRLTTVITTKATELGLDPKTIIGEVPAPRVEPPPAVDLSGYVKAEDVNARMGRFANYMMMLPAELQDISNEHFDLTGKRLSTKAIMEEVRKRAEDKRNFDANGVAIKPIDARAIWEEQNNIGTLRTTKAEEARQADLKAAEDRGYERRATEQALPGHEAPGRHAVVFKRPAGHEQKLTRGTPVAQQDRVSHAASAFASGKYRTKAS